LQEQQQIATTEVIPDSLAQEAKQIELVNQLGVFGTAASGSESFVTLENNLMKLTLSNKGGRIYSVELKDYKTHDGEPLILFDGPENQFGINFFAQNRNIQTDNLFFSTDAPVGVKVSGNEVKMGDHGDEKYNEEFPGGSQSVTFRLEVSNGSVMEYVYTLKHNSFLVAFDVKMEGMNNLGCCKPTRYKFYLVV
jgi:YidC/Oxa1 family membrane protein insertase